MSHYKYINEVPASTHKYGPPTAPAHSHLLSMYSDRRCRSCRENLTRNKENNLTHKAKRTLLKNWEHCRLEGSLCFHRKLLRKWLIQCLVYYYSGGQNHQNAQDLWEILVALFERAIKINTVTISGFCQNSENRLTDPLKVDKNSIWHLSCSEQPSEHFMSIMKIMLWEKQNKESLFFRSAKVHTWNLEFADEKKHQHRLNFALDLAWSS